jgi:small conductance mechanosensitive channel
MQELFTQNRDLIIEHSIPVLYALLTLIIGWWTIKRLSTFIENKILSEKVDESLRHFLGTLVSVLMKGMLLITVIGMVGIETTSFVAILGSMGLAIGLALSGTLQNFASGVLILFQKPFVVGDVIEAQGYIGTVKTIEIFRTVLTTFDLKTVIIPNSDLANSSMINYSTEPHRKIEWVFGIGYNDDMTLAKSIINEVIFTDKRVLDDEPFIKIAELADSAVNIKVRAEVIADDYWDVFFEKTEAIKLAFDKNNISIPYPQMDIHQFKVNN